MQRWEMDDITIQHLKYNINKVGTKKRACNNNGIWSLNKENKNKK